MIDLSAYNEPQPLRRLIQDILSPEKLERFQMLDDAYRAAKQGEIPWEHLDCAETEWQSLHHEIDAAAKVVLGTGELFVLGWPDDATDRKPTVLTPSLLADSQVWTAENEIRAKDKHYVSCKVVDSASFPLEESGTKPTKGSPGRPADPKIEAARQEALKRAQQGGKKDAIAAEIAEEFGVNQTTIRDYLKPSRTRKIG